jgi:alpha-glucosidase
MASDDWWKRAAIYQIYPLSFQDSNGDGYGDLPGLLSRVDYLAWLGISAVWLSPVHPSPMKDFGYDIADFTGVDARFGSIEDLDRLTAALHARDIRIILDLVPNHTADTHPWFIESRASRTSMKRDWYVWSDPAPDGGPPNNWLSRFGGSGWEWDERTRQYYYHAFLKEQPDLDWHNPAVRHAIHDVLRFWMRRGIDGFRVDASAVLAEDPLLRDDPPNPDFEEGKTPPPERFTRVFTDDRPETMGFLSALRRVTDEFPARVLLGEVQGATDRIGRFYGDDDPRFHLPLNFLLLDTPWDALSLQGAIDRYLNAIPGGAWPNWILGSHDKPRMASRIGREQMRTAAMLLLTLRGTPVLFAGDEIGMPIVAVPQDQVRDPFERLVPGFGLNRDPERAPMRWDASPNAGFSTGRPWLPVGEGLEDCNVAAQRSAPGSLLHFVRALLMLRRGEPVLLDGDYAPLRSQGDVLIFIRGLEDRRLLVALNIGDKPQRPCCGRGGALRLSTHMDREGQAFGPAFDLRPNEGVILELA